MKYVSRRGVVLTVLIVAVASMLTVPPAFADGKDTVSEIITAFSATDSHGLHLWQYQLDPNMGNMVTSPWKMILAVMINIVWAGYVLSVGAVGWAIDVTLSMSWVTVITGPLDTANRNINSGVLTPLGATSLAMAGIMGLLCAICAVNGAVKLLRGGLARALTTWAAGALAAGLAIGALANPVATFVGTSNTIAAPLTSARDASLQIAAVAAGPGTTGSTGGSGAAGQITVSGMLIETLIRPAHQELDYGTLIDGQKCSDGSDAGTAYDNALKAGPKLDPANSDQRDAIGKCTKAWGDYANGLNFYWLLPLIVFCVGGLIIMVLGAICVVRIWLAVLSMTWSAFSAAYHALLAIVSPRSWSALIRDGIDLALGLWTIIKKVLMLTMLLVMVRLLLTSSDTTLGPFAVRFLLADLLLLTGVVMFVWDWAHDQQLRHQWAERLRNRFQLPERHGLRDALAGAGGIELLREVNHRRRMKKMTAQQHTTSGGQPTSTGAVQRPKPTRRLTSAATTAATAAFTGGTGAVAKMAAAGAKRYTQIRHGSATHGIGTAVLPLARSHNALESTRNRIRNRIDQLKTDATDQFSQARHNHDRADASGTGLTRLDKVMATTGRAMGGVDTARQNTHAVVAQARHPMQRRRAGTPATTGRTRLDKPLAAVGKTVGIAERAYTRPRTVTPPVPRTTSTPATPRRQAPAPHRAIPDPKPTPAAGGGSVQPTATSATPATGRGSSTRRRRRPVKRS